MSPKQKKIAAKAPPPDKIDGKDFAVLKAEKAKGRGMGLQDEKVKPGKVMKARTGHFTKSNISKHERVLKPDTTKPISSVAPKVSDALKKKKLPGRIGTALGIGAMMVPAAYAAMKQYKDYKSAKNRDKAKVKKYSLGGDILTQFKDIMTGSKDSKISKAKENLKKQIAEGRAQIRDRYKVKKYSKGMSKEDITREGKKGIAAGKALGESLRDKNAPMKRQRLADRQPAKKMVGGMAKKYNKGGEGRLRSAYVYDQTVKNTKAEGKGYSTLKNLKETRREEYGAAKDRYPSKKDKLRGIAKNVGRALTPSFAAAKGVYDKLSQSTVRKYSVGGGADTGRAGERRSRLLTAVQRAARRRQTREGFTSRPSPKRTPRGGPMGSIIPERLSKQDILFTIDKNLLKDMKPPTGADPGKFKSGTMVKARGCKLGRTRPTKIT